MHTGQWELELFMSYSQQFIMLLEELIGKQKKNTFNIIFVFWFVY